MKPKPWRPGVIKGLYLRDLLDPRGARRNAIGGLADAPSLATISRQMPAATYRRVVLAGMGTSLFALYPLHMALSRQDVNSHWIETAKLLMVSIASIAGILS